MSKRRWKQIGAALAARRLHSGEKTLEDYCDHPDKYVWTYTYRKRGKGRQIVTYKNTWHGRTLRKLHRALDRYIRSRYAPLSCSFACREGGGILPCLERHLGSDTFLKLDIASFFDSMDYDYLWSRITAELNAARVPQAPRRMIFDAAHSSFFERRVPVGFVTSPILADVYLREIDNRYSQLEGIVYTRYADDFILSASRCEAEEKLLRMRDELTKALAEAHLSVNERKTYIRKLSAAGDAIRLLGLNLVKTEAGPNRITVSNSYLRETSLAWANHLRRRDEMTEETRKKDLLRISGMARFVLNASPACYAKLRHLVLIKTGAPLDLPDLPCGGQYGA